MYDIICAIIIVTNMQVSLTTCNQLLRSIAPSGNLFLLLLLQELRHQGLTFTAFYALQRVIEDRKFQSFSSAGRLGWRTMRSAAAASFLPVAD